MSELLSHAEQVWVSGGWAMIALAADGLILFTVGLNLWFYLAARRGRKIGERRWRRWLTHPDERRGAVGELIDFVTGATDLEDLTVRFEELRTTELAPVARDLRFMKRCVSVAPLLGLLGTVTGMLTTFHALASGAGGERTMDLIASGISEALITTETGLVIAIPGLFFQYLLSRQRQQFEVFLARLETVCAQKLYHALRARRIAAAAEDRGAA
ncbi:MAG: MotA/TolQ/ExbB proton channel family protein [Acidobacteria bacterium]|nr:MAG: MotA/TolQ/ExbB proton channel family protein [Acidobacteriota bacterium]